jgi:hypothetical protein
MNRKISINSGIAVPQSFITKGKQRLKQHIDTVYLKNGDEFEIELYNPYKMKILATIEINGESIGSGIVLRPAERVFLERYLNEARKFVFQTYFVDGQNKEVQKAIEDNGDVTIKFYKQKSPNTWPITNFVTTTFSGNSYTTRTSDTFLNGGTITYTTGSPLIYTSTNTGGINSTLTSSTAFYNSGATPSQNLETGRVEKGSTSSQQFTSDNTEFNSYPDLTQWWKIKPLSTKPLISEDLVVYCTECGAKRKKDNHKFCPHCGTKY